MPRIARKHRSTQAKSVLNQRHTFNSRALRGSKDKRRWGRKNDGFDPLPSSKRHLRGRGFPAQLCSERLPVWQSEHKRRVFASVSPYICLFWRCARCPVAHEQTAPHIWHFHSSRTKTRRRSADRSSPYNLTIPHFPGWPLLSRLRFALAPERITPRSPARSRSHMPNTKAGLHSSPDRVRRVPSHPEPRGTAPQQSPQLGIRGTS